MKQGALRVRDIPLPKWIATVIFYRFLYRDLLVRGERVAHLVNNFIVIYSIKQFNSQITDYSVAYL